MIDEFLQFWKGTQYNPFQQTKTKEYKPEMQAEKEWTEEEKEEEEDIKPFYLDIQALSKIYGFMIPGLKIEVGLQDLLKICPRKRERSDAYYGLVKHLKERYGVELVITSRKKNNLKKEEL